MRARTLNGDKLKVNDKRGNPIEIAAVVVWRVEDTAQAMFDVDNYENYVPIQSESALRHLASLYSYDHSEEDTEITLRSNVDEVSKSLRDELQERRLPDAAVPIDHFLRGADHPERIGLMAAGRVEDEGLVPRWAGQSVSAEAGHEAEGVCDALLLQVPDRCLVDRVAGIAEGKHHSHRQIVVSLRADEDRKLFRRSGLERSAVHQVEWPRPSPPDCPGLDLSDESVKKLIRNAKKRDYVTVDQIN